MEKAPPGTYRCPLCRAPLTLQDLVVRGSHCSASIIMVMIDAIVVCFIKQIDLNLQKILSETDQDVDSIDVSRRRTNVFAFFSVSILKSGVGGCCDVGSHRCRRMATGPRYII